LPACCCLLPAAAVCCLLLLSAADRSVLLKTFTSNATVCMREATDPTADFWR